MIETRTSFTFPKLHHNVAQAVSNTVGSTWFCEAENNEIVLEEHETSVMGKFQCKKRGCPSRFWSSKKVAIVIKGYVRNGYSAEVFNQRCKTCDTLGTFSLTESSYVERVAYRLKVWAGVHVQPPPYGGNSRKPHERQFCEGCKRGVCEQGGL